MNSINTVPHICLHRSVCDNREILTYIIDDHTSTISHHLHMMNFVAADEENKGPVGISNVCFFVVLKIIATRFWHYILIKPFCTKNIFNYINKKLQPNAQVVWCKISCF